MKKWMAGILALVMVVSLTGCDSSDYKKATSLYDEGKYEEAAAMFAELGDYENSAEMVNVCKYTQAAKLLEEKEYEAAKAIFVELGDYADSVDFSKECSYQHAEALLTEGNYEEAVAIYESIPGYLDAEDKITACKKEIMYAQYGEVIQLMTEGTWFYESDAELSVNRISFTQDAAVISQISYTGNGKSISEETSFSYLVDASNIIVSLADGSEHVIPYAVDNGMLKLGHNDYYTIEEVDAELQGYWTSRESDKILGISTSSEYKISIDHGVIKYENAAKAYGGRNGEYYYYGPHEGTYTITAYGLNADVRNGLLFGFGIVDGKVTLIRATHVCVPGSGLKGEKGYSF